MYYTSCIILYKFHFNCEQQGKEFNNFEFWGSIRVLAKYLEWTKLSQSSESTA